jgi:hypothetical protein
VVSADSGLFDSIVVTLTYLRRNRVQAELAETYGVSQPTISRAITAMTPLLEDRRSPRGQLGGGLQQIVGFHIECSCEGVQVFRHTLILDALASSPTPRHTPISLSSRVFRGNSPA